MCGDSQEAFAQSHADRSDDEDSMMDSDDDCEDSVKSQQAITTKLAN